MAETRGNDMNRYANVEKQRPMSTAQIVEANVIAQRNGFERERLGDMARIAELRPTVILRRLKATVRFQAVAAASLWRSLRIMKPVPKKPTSIIAQVAGSGTSPIVAENRALPPSKK